MSERLQLTILALLLLFPMGGDVSSAQIPDKVPLLFPMGGDVSSAQIPDKVPPQEIEEIETLDEIQEIEEIEPVGADGGMGLLEILGKLHPAVIHFPIAWMVLLLGVEGIAIATGGAGWSKAGRFLLPAAFISFLPAMATGFIHASYQGSDPSFLQLMEPHRNLAIASAILCLGALLLGFRERETLRGRRGWIYMGLISVSTLLILIAGHLGGKMVFGEQYLPF